MLEQLEHLVGVESPSSDRDACARCADAVIDIAREALGAPERIEIDGNIHLRWQFGAPTRAVLIGHFDTVWPLGTIEDLPFKAEDGLAWGPGCFDMKAGIVQAVHGLASLDSLEGVALLLTSDEEVGSTSSRGIVEYTARGAAAAFVLEPSVDGALKIARKGVGMYRLEVQGRSAHAGLEPENGANALLALAGALNRIATFGDPAVGTTVTPTTATAGTARNVVPDTAVCEIDVRAESVSEMGRVDVALRSLEPSIDDTTFNIVGGINRPPMEERTSAELFATAQKLWADLGYGDLEGRAVGGGSDGNFTAGMGIPTLDGLGAVGDGAHARHEHVVIDEMPRRAQLLAALVRDALS